MMLKYGLLATVALLGACTQTHTTPDRVVGMPYYRANTTMLGQCEKLADLYGRGTLKLNNAASDEVAEMSAIDDMRAKALGVAGSNAVLVVNREYVKPYYNVTGAAYRCP